MFWFHFYDTGSPWASVWKIQVYTPSSHSLCPTTLFFPRPPPFLLGTVYLRENILTLKLYEGLWLHRQQSPCLKTRMINMHWQNEHVWRSCARWTHVSFVYSQQFFAMCVITLFIADPRGKVRATLWTAWAKTRVEKVWLKSRVDWIAHGGLFLNLLDIPLKGKG